jgi:hypothetical protein
MPQTLAKKLGAAGFEAVKAEPVVHVETNYDPSSMSAIPYILARRSGVGATSGMLRSWL